MSDDSRAQSNSKQFVLIFVLILLALVVAFALMVRWAIMTVPQEEEVISLTEAAERIEQREIERILIQDQRNVFLYVLDQPRPLYAQLQPGVTFTATMEALDVSPAQLPPIVVED